jgi:hypothetical protein
MTHFGKANAGSTGSKDGWPVSAKAARSEDERANAAAPIYTVD